MASLGKIEVRIRDLREARLLIIELTELEKHLAERRQYESAARLNHALRRFSRMLDEDK